MVEMALVYFGDPDLGGFPVEIKRFDSEEIQADCRDDRLVVSSRIVNPDNPVDALRLMRQIHIFVGRCLLERRGVRTAGLALFLHGLLSGWVSVDLFPPDEDAKEFMVVYPLPANPTLFDVGEHLGAGAAGSEENLANVKERVFDDTSEADVEVRASFEVIVKRLSEAESPAALLDLLEQENAAASG